MKAFLIFLWALALAAMCAAETNSITTRDGVTYTNAVIQKAYPDGVVIEYAIRPGALGLAKLKFANLPEELQTKFNYSATEAKVFEQNQRSGSLRTITADERAKRAAEIEAAYWRTIQSIEAQFAAEQSALEKARARMERIRRAEEAERKRLADAQALRDWWDYGVNANLLRDLNPKPIEEP